MLIPTAINSRDFEAVIFDTDGVITDTASMHAAAWKGTFDAFLRAWADRVGEPFRPFTDEDYRRYVDGKPRYNGAWSFLQSRGISLPYGAPDDPSTRDTVCGIGNRKNEDFLQRLAGGVRPYPSSVEVVRRLRRGGVRTAVISASENAAEVLEVAGVSGLFDVRVDGRDAARLALAGKPDPAIFLEAARRLEVDPGRAVVVEDALAGVEAGHRGHFGLVVGVDRAGHPEALREHGADIVVGDLAELGIDAPPVTPPSALAEWAGIMAEVGEARPVVFLDYDGTLTPIVERPEDALLSAAARDAVRTLALTCQVAIISGRDLSDVRNKVGLDGIVYAGSHGFDLAVPPGLDLGPGPVFDDLLPMLDNAHAELARAVAGVAGAWVERKRFSIAVHYRQVREEDVAVVAAAVDGVGSRYRGLRVSAGKKVFELRPDVAWDKGVALLWLLGQMVLDWPGAVPFYLGDDTTDEDAFRAIRDRGIGIVVGAPDRSTAARYSLADPGEVRVFLERLSGR